MADGPDIAHSFGDPDSSGIVSELIAFLDSVRADPIIRGEKSSRVSALSIPPDGKVLDVGCGTADDAAALARMAPTVGIDISRQILAEAHRRHPHLPLSVSSSDALPFRDGAFSSLYCDRLLQHVDSPTKALQEMARVVAVGGSAVFHEPDFGLTTVVPDNDRVAAQLVRAQVERTRHGDIGRSLADLVSRAGFAVVTRETRTTSISDFRSAAAALPYRSLAKAAGLDVPLGRSRLNTWIGQALRAHHEGRFTVTVYRFTVVAVRYASTP